MQPGKSLSNLFCKIISQILPLIYLKPIGKLKTADSVFIVDYEVNYIILLIKNFSA